MNDKQLPDYAPVRDRLQQDGAPDLLIRQFKRAFAALHDESPATISGRDIESIDRLPTLDELQGHKVAGEQAMGQTVMIKLNGGLGTSMGLDRAKSLLKVKDGLSFLDIIARQILHIREAQQVQTPLIFMNSFSTRDDTLAALAAYPSLAADQGEIPLDFLQHRVPKLNATTSEPAQSDTHPELTWCPPGHGDLYTCLQTTGLLEQLLETGFTYAFVSNADNLGAVLDPAILGYLAEQQIPFIMEATRRTTADRKGGHLARAKDGRYLLRESAQCPADEEDEFQNIERYRFFNTNNLWLNLRVLREQLSQLDGVLPLPVLINRKTLDPRDPASTPVVQLETAMGSALSTLPDARAIDVPRTRFAPVKTTDDLLALRSDCFQVNEACHIVANPARSLPAIDIQLDSKYYKLIDAFEQRIPSPPSLVNCKSLRVEGDVHFGDEITCRDEVTLIATGSAPVHLPEQSEWKGRQELAE